MLFLVKNSRHLETAIFPELFVAFECKLQKTIWWTYWYEKQYQLGNYLKKIEKGKGVHGILENIASTIYVCI